MRLPPWAEENPWKFVEVLREAIESPYVSANLHSWVDYIFGCKQRDQEAVMSLNTFAKQTYTVDLPGDFDVTAIEDPLMRNAHAA